MFNHIVGKAVLALVVFLALAASAVAQSDTVDRPSLKAGESWTYQDIDNWKKTVQEKYTLTVKSVSDKGILFEKKSETSGATIEVTETLDRNTITKTSVDGGLITYSPDNGYYVFPLKVGMTWEAKSSYVKTNGSRGSYSYPTTVVGWEQVKVPAGEFSALKITRDGYYRSTMGTGSGTGRTTMTVWYAPSIKGIVKGEYKDTTWSGNLYNTTTTELLSYKVN